MRACSTKSVLRSFSIVNSPCPLKVYFTLSKVTIWGSPNSIARKLATMFFTKGSIAYHDGFVQIFTSWCYNNFLVYHFLFSETGQILGSPPPILSVQLHFTQRLLRESSFGRSNNSFTWKVIIATHFWILRHGLTIECPAKKETKKTSILLLPRVKVFLRVWLRVNACYASNL